MCMIEFVVYKRNIRNKSIPTVTVSPLGITGKKCRNLTRSEFKKVYNYSCFEKICHLISSSKFNLPLICTFTWPTPPGPYRATTCRGRVLNFGSHTYFFDHTRTWRASPDEWSAQCRGHLRDTTNMKDNTHRAHTQSSQQDEYEMMITTAKWYPGTLGA